MLDLYREEDEGWKFEWNALVNVVFLVGDEGKFDTILVAYGRNVVLVSSFFIGHILGHPDGGDGTLTGRSEVVDGGAHNVGGVSNADNEVALARRQAVFEIPDRFGEELCSVRTASPELANLALGGREGRRFAGFQETRGLDLVGW